MTAPDILPLEEKAAAREGSTTPDGQRDDADPRLVARVQSRVGDVAGRMAEVAPGG